MHRYKVSLLSDRHAFIKISDRVAVITKALKRPGKNARRARLVAAYVGFDTQQQAIAFVNGIKRYLSKAYCQIRRSERLATAWEVKIRYFNESALETLIWSYAENPAIVSSDNITPAEAKRSIYPTPPIAPVKVQPMKVKPIELAPLQIRSNRPLKVAGLSIE
ncbi:hypothetical protein H6F67_27205 [Microcoleus sp. FACHB-1515]|uniref:hypothetical protein n=1 Tax=Cyanophyceae TaxID=3028117 RepID=UPI001688AE02|nr:hypothetical protein [Microcoleus sp. FACHB-1515]MBD2093527.1 hypothetical protein [Microcoleus sp. FACHB-1515]